MGEKKKKFVKAVGALDTKEVEAILTFNRSSLYELLDVKILYESLESSSWKNDVRAVRSIREEVASGPFRYVVVFFKLVE